jgi:elongation factor Ts
MAAITAEMVKGLREKTGAGMMECKKALTEARAIRTRRLRYFERLAWRAPGSERVVSQRKAS